VARVIELIFPPAYAANRVTLLVIIGGR
jgi:hypothetical protein